MRGPIFDGYLLSGHPELSRYVNKAMHQPCWDAWAGADTLACLAVKQKAAEFQASITLAQGEFTGAWGYVHGEAASSFGALLFARSSKISLALAPYVGTCEIRGWTTNLLALVGMVEADLLMPGFQRAVPAKDDVPDLQVQCYDYKDNRLEVQLTSTSDKGLDETCFLRLDDLQDMRDSLQAGAVKNGKSPGLQTGFQSRWKMG